MVTPMTMLVLFALGFGGAAALSTLSRKSGFYANPGVHIEPEGDGLWIVYWQQPGTAKRDAPVIGWIRFIGDVGDDGYLLEARSIDGAEGTHRNMEDAAQWLVHSTWRVVPGGMQ